MKKRFIRFYVVALATLMYSVVANATDYTTYLTTARGFTEVTSTEAILADANYYYILAAAEDNGLIVGVGSYEAKPDWASTESKALRYKSVATDPVSDLTNFFTIEKSGSYIGLRNVVYDTDLFQTHDNAGYMYVNTYTDKALDEWSHLIPTYQNGYWLFESGKYPISSGNWACGYLGPWNKSVTDGEPIALNRRNTEGDEAGHYRLFRIAKNDLMALRLYSMVLTSGNGFTEVTTMEGIDDDPSQCYLITSAEQPSLFVGIGRYEGKPDWAGEDTKALRYHQAGNPVADLSNFFTIEKEGAYIGLRNVVHHSSLFQTHDNAGFMYVLTYTEPTMSEWCYLKPTFQNGYWLFESGKYPISSGNWACGYLGPWNKSVTDGEPIALNRRNTEGDEAGHYRLWRISRTNLFTLMQAINGEDMTWKITNPSFENDETGWKLNGKDANGNDEFKAREYGMTGKAGDRLMNAFQWWASSLGVTQTITELPSGQYELSGTVASWAGRTISFQANANKTSATGVHADAGIKVKTSVNIGTNGEMTINAGSTTDWWTEGRIQSDNETQCFFKLDDVQLHCTTLFLDAIAVALPNNGATALVPNQWYYYETSYSTEFQLVGPIDGLVYTSDGSVPCSSATGNAATRNMTLPVGRTYFKTDASDATLSITPKNTVLEGTFTAVALNVDGLPKKIATYDLNPDGPGEEGTQKISQYLSSKNYDFIGCSEDFNYNGTLMESLKDRYSCGTIRKTLSVSGINYWDLLQGKIHVETDGLNLLWKNSKISATGESWTRWSDTESTDGNQYVEKGYRHYDVQIDGGPVIDVYILHMDAGDTNATWSRESQWRQLSDAINNSDHSRAKLIIGDTNSRYTREDVINNFINRLSSDFTMSDVWVEFYRNGIYPTTDMENLTDQSDPDNYTNYEIVDKIIYINPTAANTVRLTPQAFSIQHDYTYGYVNGTDDTTPLGDHHPVVVTFKYQLSGDVAPTALTFQDNDDNTTHIAYANDVLANVTLQGRTLFKDGSWNTLALPFNMTEEQVTAQLAPSALMELDTENIVDGHKTGFEGTTLYLNFKNATAITAGTPYLIKWNDGNNIVNPVFHSVTVTDGAASGVKSIDNKVTFQGTYAPTTLAKNDPSNLFLGEDNILYYPNVDDYKVKAFRAYFHLSDNADARQIVLNFGDEETGIENVQASEFNAQSGIWHTLDGRRLNGQPKQRGIYVKDGRKEIIK